RTVRLWDAKAGKELRLVVTMKREATAVALAPDGRLVAAGGTLGPARLWDADRGGEGAQLTRATGVLPSLAFSADGAVLAAAGGGRSVVVWEAYSGEVRRVVPSAVRVLAVALSRDGRRLALARGDGSVGVQTFTPVRLTVDAEEAWEQLRGGEGAAAFDAIL